MQAVPSAPAPAASPPGRLWGVDRVPGQAGVGVRFPLVFVLGLFSLPKAQVLVDACPLFSTPVSDDLGLAHRLRKTFTVPELLVSATAAALVTPGAGGWGVEGWGASLHLPPFLVRLP